MLTRARGSRDMAVRRPSHPSRSWPRSSSPASPPSRCRRWRWCTRSAPSAWTCSTSYSGQFSFGQFVYFAVGAYVMSALRVHGNWPWGWPCSPGLLLGLLAMIVGAALVRFEVLRLRGRHVYGARCGPHPERATTSAMDRRLQRAVAAKLRPAASTNCSGSGLYYAVLIALAVGVLVRGYTNPERVAARCRQTERRGRGGARHQGVPEGSGPRSSPAWSQVSAAASWHWIRLSVARDLQRGAVDRAVRDRGSGRRGQHRRPDHRRGVLHRRTSGRSDTSGSTSDLLFAITLLVVSRLFQPGRSMASVSSWCRRSAPVRWRGKPADTITSVEPSEALEPPPAPRQRGPRDVSDELLLRVQNVSVGFGGVHALENVSVDVRRGEVHAIIGPNGAGKTTFLNCISGIQPSTRTITLAGRTSPGCPCRDADSADRPHVSTSVARRRSRRPRQRHNRGVRTAERLGARRDARHRGARHRRHVARGRAIEALRQLEFPDPRWHELADDITMGEQKHVDIARAIAGKPQLLLLEVPLPGSGPKRSPRSPAPSRLFATPA